MGVIKNLINPICYLLSKNPCSILKNKGLRTQVARWYRSRSIRQRRVSLNLMRDIPEEVRTSTSPGISLVKDNHRVYENIFHLSRKIIEVRNLAPGVWARIVRFKIFCLTITETPDATLSEKRKNDD